MNLRTTLTIDDCTRVGKLSIIELGAKTLSIGITAVLSGSDTFMGSEELKVKSLILFHFILLSGRL